MNVGMLFKDGRIVGATQLTDREREVEKVIGQREQLVDSVLTETGLTSRLY